jgi:pyrroline-5-carboxylate reductase
MASPATSINADLTVGFIGAGRMCQALSKGFHNAGLVKLENMICSDVSTEMLDIVSKSHGIKTTMSNIDVVKSSDVIIIAVKPHMVVEVLKEASAYMGSQPAEKRNKLLVSIAAGITISQIEKHTPDGMRVVRVMPNTPALVQCGASVYSRGSKATPDDEAVVNRLFSSIGYCTTLPEKYLDAVTALSGSGPAYGFLAIEALADGGVKMGLPRDIAQKLAAQTLMGAAKMVMETGQHPGQLKDAVCSPGGTTIAAVHHLEQSGFRNALIGAVETAHKKSLELASCGDQD